MSFWTDSQNGRLNAMNVALPFLFNVCLEPIDGSFDELDIDNFSYAPIVFYYHNIFSSIGSELYAYQRPTNRYTVAGAKITVSEGSGTNGWSTISDYFEQLVVPGGQIIAVKELSPKYWTTVLFKTREIRM